MTATTDEQGRRGHDYLTRRTMARNTHENAIVKEAQHSPATADTYRQAAEYAQQAIDAAQNDYDRSVAERMLKQIHLDLDALQARQQERNKTADRSED